MDTRDSEVTDAEFEAVFDEKADREKTYDRDIAPIVAKLRAACRARGLPHYVVVQFSEYGMAQTASVPPGAHGAFGPILEVLEESDPIPPEGLS